MSDKLGKITFGPPTGFQSMRERDELRTRLAEAEAALDRIRQELGVPGEGYPMPVSNAVDILTAYFEKWGEKP